MLNEFQLLRKLSVQKLNKSNLDFKLIQYYKSLINNLFRVSSTAVLFRLKFTDSFQHLRKGEINELKRIINKNRDAEENKIEILFRELELFKNRNTSELDKDIFSIELLLLKRALSKRDRFSGQISFPGGKMDKDDFDDYSTAIRETMEEIGINLEDENKIQKLYLGETQAFDMTPDLRNLVYSHAFLIFDFSDNFNELICLNKAEISEYVWIPLKYFIELENAVNTQNGRYLRRINQIVMLFCLKKSFLIDKIILNQNENLLLFGMTQRIIINSLNIRYVEKYYHNKISDYIIFNIMTMIRKLIQFPMKNMKFLRYCMFFFSSVILYNVILYSQVNYL